MWSIIRSEWQKLRRCQIILVGVVALALCPVVQYGSQLVQAPEYREQNFDFARLFANVIWGNSQIFLPISLVMIGGWLIDREAAGDTLKNVVTVPVPVYRLLGGKLLVTALLALIFGAYSVCVTLLTGMIVGLPGLSTALVLHGGLQVIGAALTTYVVCMPMILIFGQLRGAYLGGAILTFFLGYSMLFFKSGVLLSAYPFSAALILVGFDMAQYNGATAPVDRLLAAVGLSLMVMITLFLLVCAARKREVAAHRAKRTKSRKRGTRGRR